MAASTKNHALIDELTPLSDVFVPWCDEFEKMVSGMTFHSGNDKGMQKYRIEIMRRLRSFNDNSIPDDASIESLKARRMAVAKQMLGKLGDGANIEPPFFCGWGCNTFVGDGAYMNRNVSIYDNAPVFIGNRVLIGPDVIICTGTHDVDPAIRQETGGSFAYPIRIEDDCWIGAGVTICPGVRIGQGTTVAAGAVVTKDVEGGSLVGGVPAKVIKRLKVENRDVMERLKNGEGDVKNGDLNGAGWASREPVMLELDFGNTNGK